MTFSRCIFFVGLQLALFMQLVSCEKLVEPKSPPTAQTSENIYTDDIAAASVLTGIYTSLSYASPFMGQSITSLSVAAGLSADELMLYGGSANANTNLLQFYQNKLTAGLPNTAPATIWSDFYSKLYILNIALERLATANSLTKSVRQQLIGEAKFMRAFCYFYLVNLYGDVPLVIQSDYRVNAVLSRAGRNIVYQQIIDDLKEAKNLLSENYVAADAYSVTAKRVRPNKWAAIALLARTYLFNREWSNAELEASAVINNTSLYDTVSLNKVFLKNSKEAIWQLQPVNFGWNTEDAKMFVLPASGPTTNSSASGYPVYINSQWMENFETNDKRQSVWVNSVVVNAVNFYYPAKYKATVFKDSLVEYLVVLRLGEQYLIRAEARAQQDKITEAQSDLNVIRARAGLPALVSSDKNSLLASILKERQVELFTEWGHRWLDLKRVGKIDNVMNVEAIQKGTTWSTNWQLWPIPQYDITLNPNLDQNPGY